MWLIRLINLIIILGTEWSSKTFYHNKRSYSLSPTLFLGPGFLTSCNCTQFRFFLVGSASCWIASCRVSTRLNSCMKNPQLLEFGAGPKWSETIWAQRGATFDLQTTAQCWESRTHIIHYLCVCNLKRMSASPVELRTLSTDSFRRLFCHLRFDPSQFAAHCMTTLPLTPQDTNLLSVTNKALYCAMNLVFLFCAKKLFKLLNSFHSTIYCLGFLCFSQWTPYNLSIYTI